MIIIREKAKVAESLEFLRKRIMLQWSGARPIEVVFKNYVADRTRSQNALYWKWCTEMGQAVGRTKDDIHDLMRYKFLGHEEVTVGADTFARLRSTTKLSAIEMGEYMTKIEAWALELGIYLTIPGDSEYAKYREAAQ